MIFQSKDTSYYRSKTFRGSNNYYFYYEIHKIHEICPWYGETSFFVYRKEYNNHTNIKYKYKHSKFKTLDEAVTYCYFHYNRNFL